MPGRTLVRLAEQLHRLVVAVALRMLSETRAADGVRGRDTGVHAQRHVGVGTAAIVGVVDQIRRIKKLNGLS